MTEDLDWRKNFRPDIPSSARIYDYLLGGKDNYPADREVATRLTAQLPNAPVTARQNRAYLNRAVRYLVNEAGIRQIVDIGAGIPTMENTHEVAQAANPDVRVVYVDHDPVVLTHARNMLHNVPNTTIIEHDLRQPDQILHDPILTTLISADEPVAFMMLALLHFIQDADDPAGIIERLTRSFPAGSHVVLSHATNDEVPGVTKAGTLFQRATEHARVRTGAEILRLVGDMAPVDPGLVWLHEWRPDPDTTLPENVTQSFVYALVAKKQ